MAGFAVAVAARSASESTPEPSSETRGPPATPEPSPPSRSATPGLLAEAFGWLLPTLGELLMTVAKRVIASSAGAGDAAEQAEPVAPPTPSNGAQP